MVSHSVDRSSLKLIIIRIQYFKGQDGLSFTASTLEHNGFQLGVFIII